MIDGGYTPAEIDKFVLADVSLIFRGWRRTPPIRAMVAGYLGIKPGPDPDEPLQTIDAAQLRAMFPG